MREREREKQRHTKIDRQAIPTRQTKKGRTRERVGSRARVCARVWGAESQSRVIPLIFGKIVSRIQRAALAGFSGNDRGRALAAGRRPATEGGRGERRNFQPLLRVGLTRRQHYDDHSAGRGGAGDRSIGVHAVEKNGTCGKRVGVKKRREERRQGEVSERGEQEDAGHTRRRIYCARGAERRSGCANPFTLSGQGGCDRRTRAAAILEPAANFIPPPPSLCPLPFLPLEYIPLDRSSVQR